jgi:hypothetical protein
MARKGWRVTGAAGAAGVGAYAGKERVAGSTAEAMLLWLDAALKK